MKFDPDENFAKHCGYGVPAFYTQNGGKFDAGFNYVGKVADPDDTPEKRETDKQSVRDRAKKKLALKGFAPSDKPDAVQEALSENQAARNAEDLME